GLRKNVRVGIAYTNGWNQDIGCVAWDNLMEDLATLEISRAQVWQWLHNRVMLEDGQTVTPELVKEVFEEELEKIKQEVVSEMEGQSEARKDKVLKGFVKAKEEAEALFTKETFDEFFSLKSQLV
ncbi:MAG: malate synthase A, partial [Blastocatellia bacterium]|nr:malate synthase A [Blastocatellia bacterium]